MARNRKDPLQGPAKVRVIPNTRPSTCKICGGNYIALLCDQRGQPAPKRRGLRG
jgi:hypothetical protein